MSYRAAWGRLRASEERMGVRLIESDAARKGMALTPAARALLDRFRQLEKDADAYLRKMSRELSALVEAGAGSKPEGGKKV